jgi:nitroreductase
MPRTCLETALPDRTPDHPIDPQFIRRWSPRAFTGEPIDEPTLLGFLEAARWAPSASNIQPWRFIYGRAGTAAWAPIFEALVPSNQVWAQRASALIVVLSRTVWIPQGKTEARPNASHAFDAGTAWGFLALQVAAAGWHAHAMGGFDHDRARSSLGIPPDHALHAVVAVGRRAEKSVLPENLQAREVPNQRVPLSERAAEGRFDFPA